MELEKADLIAKTTALYMDQHCKKLLVAGSVRRRVPLVGDIEIVCLPKMTTRTSATLFGTEETPAGVTEGFKAAVARLGEPVKGQVNGRYMQIKNTSRLGVIYIDLFMPQADDYWRQFVIRTGSVEYVRSHIATAWVRKGWVGTPDGLRRAEDCQFTESEGKKIWHCTNPNAERPPVWNSEDHFFSWLELPFIDPTKR